MKVMKPINAAMKGSNGYKTKSTVFIYLLLQIFGKKLPISPANQEILIDITDVLMASGLFHDFWRNRVAITEWIRNLFTIKKRVL
jgi:hypothetical protein